MNPPSLLELELWMKSQIDLKSLANGSRERLQGKVPLNLQGGEEGEKRLGVYEGGYIARTRDGLKEAYETICPIIGEKKLAELAEVYAVRFPSKDYNLSFFGRNLPEFLLDYPLTLELPFLPDLAKLEWAVCLAFHAFDEAPLNPSRLSSVVPDDWEKLTFKFQPSTALIESEWPVLDLWQTRHKHENETHLPKAKGFEKILVFRNAFFVYCEAIDEKEYLALRALMSGNSLSAVCESLLELGDEEAPPISEWFSKWMGRGIIATIHVH